LLLLIHTTYKNELTKPLCLPCCSNFLILFCRCPGSHQYFFQSLSSKDTRFSFNCTERKGIQWAIFLVVRSVHHSRPGKNLGEDAGVSSRRELNLFKKEENTILAGSHQIYAQILPRYFT